MIYLPRSLQKLITFLIIGETRQLILKKKAKKMDYKLYYCRECNDVYENRNKDRQCVETNHTKFIITPKMYTDWIVKGKPILQKKQNENI